MRGWWNGRHERLKISWANSLCGFKSRSAHQIKSFDMAKTIKKITKKKRTVKPNQSTNFVNRKVESVRSFLDRRPHRSFKLSHKVDYVRPLEIEGYFKFSQNVIDLIIKNSRFFIGIVLASSVELFLFTGLMPQTAYNSLKTAIDESYSRANLEAPSGLFKAGLLFLSTVTDGGTNAQSSESKQLLLVFIFAIVWLSVVWYLRNYLAGNQIKLREAVYSSGAPLVPMLGIMLIIVIQLIPLFIYLIAYASAIETQLIQGGVESMIIYSIGFLIIVLSLYWVLSSLLAMVLITIPGMYPMQAISLAGDLSVGRRGRLLKRIIWHMVQVISLWVIVLIPLILVEDWISNKTEIVSSFPLVQSVQVLLLTSTFAWTSAYIYLLYRRIIEDKSKPV